MVINVKSETAMSGFYIIFKGSTMNEKPGWYGISHLCEHILCKAIFHLQDTYQQKNIKWNAYTSVDTVVFYMTGIDRHINKYKNDFLNLLLDFKPTQKQLDNEKKIVLEEYKMSFNSQIESHYFNLQRKMLSYYNPIGLRSDIENITLQDCNDYLDLYFKNPTKIINVSKFNDFETDIKFKVEIDVKPFEFKINDNLYIITSDDNTDVPKGMIPLEIITEFKNKVSIIDVSTMLTKDFAYASFVCEMLSSGLNSPLYKEVREKLGLVYYISCSLDKLNDKSCSISIITNTSKNNIERVQHEIKNILQNKEIYLTQERFDIIKDKQLTKIEENEILNNNISKYMENPEWMIENIINTITLDDVYRVVDEYLNWDNMYKSVDINEFS